MSNGFRTSAAIAAWAMMIAAAAPGAALAQDAGALGGTAIPGLCSLSQNTTVNGSKIGQAATARLHELEQTSVNGLNAERQAIQADVNALNAEKASLSAADLQKRQQALQQRFEASQAKVNVLNRQIEATRAKAIGQIAKIAQPLVAQAYQAHNCGMLLSREAILGGNLSNDLSEEVIKSLDAKQTTITFELEPPPAAPPAK